ncbi:NADH-quinone oxidoreductase subunit N [Trichonephila clavata]|uniref:NADH:ubiquinone reductase (H(+)-translocating) n=1 Tax=Trichonephila clavata TaxID=2740835 RepID=A0A8X6HBG7_TRICU|nr:NADH-quinone oxidoreductase subunit N [Trichonephila clavata]GFR26927.1 NADH-quinone oxidoreductase subunit N [Trichonephila clavata]
MGKSAQLGLHVWLPDAMEGPTPVSALIHAATMVTAGIFLVAKCSPLFELSNVARELIVIVGALTAFFAATVAITQNDIKKIIAYSTCSQLGYMFMACGLSAYNVAIFHLMTHAFFKALLFLGAGNVIHAMHHEQNIQKMGNCWKKIPCTYTLMWIGSLALSGIFPFAGFYSKDLIIEHAYSTDSFAFVISLVVAFFTAFYSWRLLLLVFHSQKQSKINIHEAPKIMLIPLLILAFGSVFSGVWGANILNITSNAFWKSSLVMIDEHGVHNFFIKLLPTLASLSGIALAYLIYQYQVIRQIKSKFLLKFLQNKWYFDEVYEFVIIAPIRFISRLLWKFDVKAIDSFGPNGVVRFSIPMLPQASLYFSNFVVVLSIIAVIYASLVAFAQDDIKKLIAYSSIAHMGIVTAGLFSFCEEGVLGSIFQMISHGLISAALFLCVGMLYTRTGTLEIAKYFGIVNTMPKFGFMFILFSMASIGLPGTSGFVAFELMSISLYVLASFNKDSIYSCEAGVKYFTLSALSSCIMLYGMSLLYGYTGQVNFSELGSFLQNHQITYGIVFGLVFVLIGLCFKLAIVPFHMWAPDVYQGAPTIVTAFFSTAPKAALVTFLIRLMNEELVNVKSYVQPIFLYVSALSVLISAFGALRQQNLKRLLAYSSIGHIGFIFASLSIFTQAGTDSALMYLVIYIITSIGLFSYLVQIDDDDCDIANLSGIGKKRPIVAFHLSVLLLSMSGIPPLAGFFAKFFIFKSLINSGFISLSLILVIASVISCYYYLNIMKVMSFDKASGNKVAYSRGLFIITSVVSLINLVLFLYVEDLYSLIELKG